jgi:thymidylate synthase
MKNPFDETYCNLVRDILNNGFMKYNHRTGKGCLTLHGAMCKYNLEYGEFPALTTKKLLLKPMIGELLGFIRGVDNAKDFRDLGCNFWNDNANVSKDWLENPNRRGEDDLGRIYGVQARRWTNSDGQVIDQLGSVIDKLTHKIDDRRLIVSHWNPGELNKMALAPCHKDYQFSIKNDEILELSVTQRSNDVPLGTPMNIASYALLLLIVCKITGLRPGVLTHFMVDTHIYEDQIELIEKQITRKPFYPPRMLINPKVNSLTDVETWATHDDFTIVNYEHHPAIKFPFAP